MPLLFLLSGPKIGFSPRCPDKRAIWHGEKKAVAVTRFLVVIIMTIIVTIIIIKSYCCLEIL